MKINRRTFVSILGVLGISTIFARRARATWFNLGLFNKRKTPTLPTPSVAFTASAGGGYYTISNIPAGATVNWTWNITAGHGETHYAVSTQSWSGAAPATFTNSNTDSTAYASNAYCSYSDAIMNWSLSATFSMNGYTTSALYTNSQNINTTSTCYSDYSDYGDYADYGDCSGYTDSADSCSDCSTCNCN